VAHQLPVAPETATLGQLLRERITDCFDLYRVPPAEATARLVFGGDVMLGRGCAEKIHNGTDPFTGISSVLGAASFAAANLECTISNLGEPINRYAFRAPVQSARLLRQSGFKAMGLANNHALDFGAIALHDSAAHLLREQIEPVGVETATRSAYEPGFFPVCNGKKIALLAINDVDAQQVHQIATSSVRAKLAAAITQAQAHANIVVCLVHWGIENSEATTREQRELARWLIDRGVDLVVGSHPHCLEPLDYYHGCPIAYSLGNLVFDGAPTVSSWNRSALLEVDLNDDAKISKVSLIPVTLRDGLPRLEITGSSRFGSR
jgi:poly-gamma-glutamate synthesis protein (capsule biosynthesis protein)